MRLAAAHKRPIKYSTHPDRLTKATASEKKIATEQFQAVADAYFVLSDKTRRSEYDMLARSSGTNKHSAGAGDFAFKDFASMFGAGGGHSGEADFEDLPRAETGRPDPQGVFANVFDDVRLSFPVLLLAILML